MLEAIGLVLALVAGWVARLIYDQPYIDKARAWDANRSKSQLMAETVGKRVSVDKEPEGTAFYNAARLSDERAPARASHEHTVGAAPTIGD